MLDSAGQIVELPFDLTRPFARFVAQNGITDVKRFAFERVFRSSSTGGQPRQPHECDFDIVSSSGHEVIDEAEVLKVAVEVIEECSDMRGPALLCIVVNNGCILEALMTQAQIPKAKHEKILHLLVQHPSNPFNSEAVKTKRRNALQEADLGTPQSSLEALLKWGDLGEHDAIQRIKTTLPMRALDELEELVELLRAANVDAKVVFDPLFCYHPHMYCGLIFQVVTEMTKHRLDILAGGGRYDRLVEQYRVPSAKHQHFGAVGVSFSVAKLAASMDKKRAVTGRGERLIDIDVMVYSFGAKMLADRMAVCADLWKADIKAEFMNHDEVNQELLHQACRSRGINWVIILKEHQSRGPFGTVRIRNLERRNDIEVPRRDLVDSMLKALSESAGAAEDLPSTSAAATSMLSVTINAGSKSSSKISSGQRSIIRDKAVRALSPFFTHLSLSKPVEIVAHDLSKHLASRLLECIDQKDEASIKRLMDGDEREALGRLRQSIGQLREKSGLVVLYNYKYGDIDFLAK